MADKFLILIGGLVKSGKSFLADLLAKDMGVHIDKGVCTSKFIDAMLKQANLKKETKADVKSRNKVYNEDIRDVAYEMTMDIASSIVDNEYYTIVSASFLKEFGCSEWRTNIIEKMEDKHAKCIFIYVNASEDIIKERLSSCDNEFAYYHWDEYIMDIPEHQFVDIIITNNNDSYNPDIISIVDDYIKHRYPEN